MSRNLAMSNNTSFHKAVHASPAEPLRLLSRALEVFIQILRYLLRSQLHIFYTIHATNQTSNSTPPAPSIQPRPEQLNQFYN